MPTCMSRSKFILLILLILLSWSLIIALNIGSVVVDNSTYFNLLLQFRHPHTEHIRSSALLRSTIVDLDVFEDNVNGFCAEQHIVDCAYTKKYAFEKYAEFISYHETDRNTLNERIKSYAMNYFDIGYNDYFDGKIQTNTCRNIDSTTCAPKAALTSLLLTVVTGIWQWNTSYSDTTIPRIVDQTQTSTLGINMPHIIFTSESLVTQLTAYRHKLATKFVVKDLSTVASHTTHNIHSSKVAMEHIPLHKIASVLCEKMNILYIASQIGRSEYYAWVDTDLFSLPIPSNRSRKSSFEIPSTLEWSEDVIRSLPVTRLSYSLLRHPALNPSAALIAKLLGISAEEVVSGAAMIAHKSIIPMVQYVFNEELKMILQEGNSSSPIDLLYSLNSSESGVVTAELLEQVILTRMQLKHPTLFHVMSYDGDVGFLWGVNNT